MAMNRQAQPSAMILGIIGAAGMLGAAAFAAAKRLRTGRRSASSEAYSLPTQGIAGTGGLEGVQSGSGARSTSTDTSRETGTDVEDSAHELVSSARVEGTPVFNPNGERLGVVHSVMLYKRSGQVAYALLSFGTFLDSLKSMGRRVYPMPWDMLTYDQDRHGYIVDLDRKTLEAAPSLSLDEADRPSGAAYETNLYTLHGATRYWQSWTPII